MKRFLVYEGPALFWAIGIFIGSSIPAHDLPTIVILTPDKLLHIGVFFVFGLLVYRTVTAQEQYPFLRVHNVLSTLLIAGGYGVFDEVHQYFVPGRMLDIFDVVADFIGMTLGLMTMRIILKRRKKGTISPQELIRD